VLCTSPSSYWSTNLLSPLHPLLLSYHSNSHLLFTFMILTHINWFHFFLTEYLFTPLRMSLRGPYPWSTKLLYTTSLSTHWLFICPDEGGSRIHYNIRNIPPTYMVLYPEQSCCHSTAMIALHLPKSIHELSCCTSYLSIPNSPLNLATVRNSSYNICTYPECHCGVLCQLRHINGKFPQQLE
jgi:hypothetical protein